MLSTRTTKGLAVAAVSVLAAAGLPLAASATTVGEQVKAGNLVLYSQFNAGNDASTRPDGTDSRVRLAAGAGPDITAVTFAYSLNGVDFRTIATVNRNDDGAFTHDWDSSALEGAVVVLRASASVGGKTVEAVREGVEIRTAKSGEHSVALARGSRLGYFPQPYSGITKRAYAVVAGTTSATTGTVAVSWLDGTGARQATSNATVTAATGASTGSFQQALVVDGIVDADPATTDEVVVAAERDTDDVTAYELYAQQITTVTAVADRTTVQAGETAKVMVTVKDQHGQPIAGAQVLPSTAGASPQYTDQFGRTQFTQGGSEQGHAVRYHANADDDLAYDESKGDRQSAAVTVKSYTPTSTTLQAGSADGLAFDVDEHASGDLTVQVQDQHGDPLATAFREVSYFWLVVPFDGKPANLRVPATGASTARTDTTGKATIALPAAEPGSYTLHAALAADSNGDGGIASKPVLTVKAGQSRVDWDQAGPEQALAGTTEQVTGTLELEDGTALPGRTLDLAWTAGKESEPAGTGDAGLVQPDGKTATTLQVKTDNGGRLSAAVKDPAESPQPLELGGLLDVSRPADSVLGAADVVASDHGVDFLRTIPVGSVAIAADAALSSEGRTPGRPVSSSVTVRSATGTPLANQEVTLTTDRGFFTSYAATMANLTPAASPTAGDDAGVWRSLGRQVKVRTDGNGVAPFTLAIERDAGFDDDGEVRATVTATVASAEGRGVSDTEDVDWTTRNPFNGGEVRVEPAPAALQESGVLPKAPLSDAVLLDVLVEDQFGNPVPGETVQVGDDTTGADVSATTVTTDLDADGDVTATATAAGDQLVQVTWATETHTYGAGGSHAPAGTERLTGDDTVEWYAVDLAASTFGLATDRRSYEVGEAATVTYSAVDQHGEPVTGLVVALSQTGPGDRSVEAQGVTGQAGTVDHVFTSNRRGEVSMVAAVTAESGETVRGTRRQLTFGYGIDPEVVAALHGRSNGARADRLQVRADRAAAGARVRLYEIRRGRRVLVARGRLDDQGTWRVRVADDNGRARTTYQVRVLRTDVTTGTWTNRRRVR